MIIPVILSGGVGSRLWPLSRADFPKQFALSLGEHTLFQESVLRSRFCLNDPLFVCNEKHRYLLLEQLEDIKITASGIILEPQARGTAPAIALAAFQAMNINKENNPILLVLPADHVIADQAHFEQAIKIGERCAKAGKLITFGCKPDSAATGFGYIKQGGVYRDGAYCVERFVEKPDALTAEAYFSSQQYFWNSGIFLFKASTYLEALKSAAPKIFSACREAAIFEKDHHFLRPQKKSFLSCIADSIDYAVMQKSTDSVVVPLNVKCSDMGSWGALYDHQSKAHHNVIKGDVLLEKVENCYLHASHRLIAAVGLKDHVVVETRDAVLVANKNNTQEVKVIVKQLENDQRDEAKHHTQIYRPWGSCEVLDKTKSTYIRRLIIKPGASVSLQKHMRRSEHWVVISGIASVVCNEKAFAVNTGESTYIPAGAKHSLENKTKNSLEIIEIQTGEYLDERDVQRFENLELVGAI